MKQHLQEGRDYGISGVPTFVLGTKIVVGAHPYEVLEKVFIEELSNNSGKGK